MQYAKTVGFMCKAEQLWMHATFGPTCNIENMLDLYAMQKINMQACNSLGLGLTCN